MALRTADAGQVQELTLMSSAVLPLALMPRSLHIATKSARDISSNLGASTSSTAAAASGAQTSGAADSAACSGAASVTCSGATSVTCSGAAACSVATGVDPDSLLLLSFFARGFLFGFSHAACC